MSFVFVVLIATKDFVTKPGIKSNVLPVISDSCLAFSDLTQK